MLRVVVAIAVLLVTAGATGAGLATDVVGLDDDGLTEVQELQAGTDPRADDTDGDGLDDGRELSGATSPTDPDTDGDGLDDGTEVAGASDPTDPDTDDDGLEDEAEVEAGSDPTVGDTDGDGLGDAREVDVGSDPAAADTDGDGVADRLELQSGSDPTMADTDGDGLPDEQEVESASLDPAEADSDDDGLADPRELELGTDPGSADTDRDLLADADELEAGTDPLAEDTDGDELLDGWEVEGESPQGTPLPEADPLAMDLYVEVNVVVGAASIDDYDLVERYFSRMPIENPDGTTGIDIHVEEGEGVNESIEFDGDNYWDVAHNYAEPLTADRRRTHHSVLIVPFETDDAWGWGDSPGRDAVVSGAISDQHQREVMVHELLHNVVGEIDAEGACPNDPDHYCAGGWLESGSGDRHLPQPLADEIEEQGFQSGWDRATGG